MAKTPRYTVSGKNSYKKGENHKGWESMFLTLERLQDNVSNSVRKQLEKEAKKVVEVARKMAPIDEHNLEKAIKYESVGTGARGKQGRNAKGQFDKNSWVIGVDVNDTAGASKRVGDYAMLVHEYLPWGTDQKVVYPGGEWGLGPKSLEKQKNLSGEGIEVGGAFMYRAMEKVNGKGMIKRRVTEAIESVIDKFVIKKKH